MCGLEGEAKSRKSAVVGVQGYKFSENAYGGLEILLLKIL
jgi:hypothetical protein